MVFEFAYIFMNSSRDFSTLDRQSASKVAYLIFFMREF